MSTNPVSVKYFDGVFYSPTWVTVFIPLTDADCVKYRSAVLEAETQAQRKLTVRELIEIARKISQ